MDYSGGFYISENWKINLMNFSCELVFYNACEEFESQIVDWVRVVNDS